MQLSFCHLRRAFIAIVTCAVTLAVIWWGIWSFAAAQYRHVINGWIEAGRANGYVISFDDSRLFGFPRHVVLRLTNVQWKDTDNIQFHADDIDIGAVPWHWQNFTAKFKNHVQIDAPIEGSSESLVLGGEDGRAEVELDSQGYWLRSKVSLTHAHVGQNPHYVAVADWLEASAERPERMPTDHSQAGLTLAANAVNVTLPETIPSPFGNQMKALDLNLRVMDIVPDFRKRSSVDAWNKESGVVEFDRLHMDWGPLNINAKGTMGFDDDLQPEGAFNGAIVDTESVLKALMEHGYIAAQQQEMMNSALSLFSKPTKFNNNTALELPIAVQLGGLFLGPVRMFAFPPIDWPAANTAPEKP